MLLRALDLRPFSLWLLSLYSGPEGPAPSGPASPFALHAWASKEKVTRTPAGIRNARCIGGPVAGTHRQVRGRHESSFCSTTKRKALDPGLRRDDDVGGGRNYKPLRLAKRK